jgi:hypothetical protein
MNSKSLLSLQDVPAPRNGEAIVLMVFVPAAKRKSDFDIYWFYENL